MKEMIYLHEPKIEGNPLVYTILNLKVYIFSLFHIVTKFQIIITKIY